MENNVSEKKSKLYYEMKNEEEKGKEWKKEKYWNFTAK